MFSASLMSTTTTTTTTTNNNNSTSLSEEAASYTSTVSSAISTRVHEFTPLSSSMAIFPFSDHSLQQQNPFPNHQKIKKRRNLPGNPDPDAEVIALSPTTLMATNRFVCEICNKGFQRDQNLQLHRRGHNLPWKLKQRSSKDQIKKRAYVCPEPTCVHHHPSRALGDLTGIKKHFCRKHGEKKWKCDKCSKIYAVQSDWKAHSKTCGTREYRCDCGTLFSRKDSFITHRAFCDALAEESARLSAAAAAASGPTGPSSINNITQTPFNIQQHSQNPSIFPFSPTTTPQISLNPTWVPIKPENLLPHNQLLLPAVSSPFYQESGKDSVVMTPAAPPFHRFQAAVPSAHLSATALLQKAATVGAVSRLDIGDLATWQKTDRLTRDFLGLTGDQDQDHHHHHRHHHHRHGHGGGDAGNDGSGGVDVSVNVRNMLTYTGGIELPTYTTTTTAASETWGNC